jgi:hypothetical protein
MWTVLVDLIVAVIDEVNAQRARFSQAVEAAQDAMWATFAARYPEVTTGDLAPGADHAFVTEATRLLAGWLDDNFPARTVPTHIADLAARDHADSANDPHG